MGKTEGKCAINYGDGRRITIPIGSDVGCGIAYFKAQNVKIDIAELDRVLRERIPTGEQYRNEPHRYSKDFDFSDLDCGDYIDRNRAALSLGTLGGGNHFVEVGKAKGEEGLYFFVHSGSRFLGEAVCEYYIKQLHDISENEMKGNRQEVTAAESALLQSFAHDIYEVQGFAMLNREIILLEIEKSLGVKAIEFGECIHNYADETGVFRKGTVSTRENDVVIVPLKNHRGIMLGKGKGKTDICAVAEISGVDGKCGDESDILTEKIIEPVYSFGADTTGAKDAANCSRRTV